MTLSLQVLDPLS